MSTARIEVHVDDLVAVADWVTAAAESWTVWSGGQRVGVLQQRRDSGAVWLTGSIAGVDEVLVAEGPTALSVLRRLACRVAVLRCEGPVRMSPVRT